MLPTLLVTYGNKTFFTEIVSNIISFIEDYVSSSSSVSL